MKLQIREKMNARPATRAIVNTRWILAFILVLLFLYTYIVPQNTQIQLGIWKIVLGFILAVSGHVFCKVVWPDMSLSTLLKEDNIGYKFLGACVLRGFVMLGFLIGGLLGI